MTLSLASPLHGGSETLLFCITSLNCHLPYFSFNSDDFLMMFHFFTNSSVCPYTRGLHRPRPDTKPISGLARQMRKIMKKKQMIFPTGRDGLGNVWWFFQGAGPGRQKDKWDFWRPSLGTEKGIQIILRISPGRQNKDEVLKPADKSLIMNLI